MAVIRVTAEWNHELERYVPSTYSIEGTGNISIAYRLMNEIEPEYGHVDKENQLIYFGPYRLKIVAQSRSIDGEYLCQVIE